jgi:hypothetical protein
MIHIGERAITDMAMATDTAAPDGGGKQAIEAGD